MREFTIIENFDGHPVALHQGDAFVNLTAMCAVFGKRPQAFINLDGTKAFMEELLRVNDSQPIISSKQGQSGGTWAHPDLAVKCAAWLSPKLDVWIMRTIRRILTGDPTVIPELEIQMRAMRERIVELEAATSHVILHKEYAPVNSFGDDGKEGFRRGAFVRKGGFARALRIFELQQKAGQRFFTFIADMMLPGRSK